MKHGVIIAALVAVGLATTLPASGQVKVGYVDVDRVTRKAKAVNQAMDSVQNDIEALQKQIDDKRQQIKELEADVQRSEGVIASGEIEKKRKEIARLRNELDDLAYRAERKARELDATVFEPLMKRILFAIQDVAKENKYDIILRGEAVLYGTSAVDITDEVIQKLNQDAKETSPSQTERGETLRSEEKPADRVKDSEPSPSQEALGQAKESSAQTKPLATKKPSSETQSKPKRPVDRQPD